MTAPNAPESDGQTQPIFTTEQVAHLHQFQASTAMHPFTCPNRGDGKHFDNGHDKGMLTPTVRGWICQCCDYTQDWAHDFMLDGSGVELQTGMLSILRARTQPTARTELPEPVSRGPEFRHIELRDWKDYASKLSARCVELQANAAIGTAFMDKLPEDYSWSECPSEYMVQVANQLYDAQKFGDTYFNACATILEPLWAAGFDRNNSADPEHCANLVKQLVERTTAAEASCEELAETHRMQMVAISVACQQNTLKSAESRLQKDHPYWTIEYGDVCRTVDREIALRDQIEACRRDTIEECAKIADDHLSADKAEEKAGNPFAVALQCASSEIASTIRALAANQPKGGGGC